MIQRRYAGYGDKNAECSDSFKKNELKTATETVWSQNILRLKNTFKQKQIIRCEFDPELNINIKELDRKFVKMIVFIRICSF